MLQTKHNLITNLIIRHMTVLEKIAMAFKFTWEDSSFDVKALIFCIFVCALSCGIIMWLRTTSFERDSDFDALAISSISFLLFGALAGSFFLFVCIDEFVENYKFISKCDKKDRRL